MTELVELSREAPSLEAGRLEDAEEERREDEVTVLGAPFPIRPTTEGDVGADDVVDLALGLSHEEKKSSSVASPWDSVFASGIPSTKMRSGNLDDSEIELRMGRSGLA